MAIEQIKMYVCITMHGCKNTKSFGNSKEKYGENLEVTGKMLFFTTSELSFGYPGDIPAWEQD